MAKFKLPVPPATTNKCIRFPNDLIEGIERAITGTNCTFSAFIIEAARVALKELEEDDPKSAES